MTTLIPKYDEGSAGAVNRPINLKLAEFVSVLDFGAEWRYYGADDTNSSDPTRCGMPINPLLKESSFGCKITCNSHSSYEMRKIRRFTDWQSMPYHEKSKYDDFQIITILASTSGIPKIIIDDAIRYYDKISDKEIRTKSLCTLCSCMLDNYNIKSQYL